MARGGSGPSAFRTEIQLGGDTKLVEEKQRDDKVYNLSALNTDIRVNGTTEGSYTQNSDNVYDVSVDYELVNYSNSKSAVFLADSSETYTALSGSGDYSIDGFVDAEMSATWLEGEAATIEIIVNGSTEASASVGSGSDTIYVDSSFSPLNSLQFKITNSTSYSSEHDVSMSGVATISDSSYNVSASN